MEEILELNKEKTPKENISNLISDENDLRDKSYEDFSTNMEDVSEESMMSAKELEAKFFEEAAANNDRSDVAENMELHELKEIKNQSTGNSSGGSSFAGEVMISFNLKDRRASSLLNPGYTCNGSGTVVIQIKVDKSGAVKTVSYVQGSSKGATSCMIEKALKYAKKSRFDYHSDMALQTGTITYKFMGK